ncbi:hypothetical protein DB347_00835 [Opitutaceae bacterium EW11]|nr:hypothetical protein DB347_00835 [Opitutaceae bacterium EW11]
MPEPSRQTDRAYPTSAVSAFLDSAWATIGPGLYRTNPFRILGCPVLSSAREISRRFDQLKIASQLGNPLSEWSLAPEPPASADALRNAVQMLKDPRQRFLAEAFWFWPETYPANGDDPALKLLARRATSDAVSAWAAGAINDSVAALHNLTVYHHLMAIEQEQALPPLPEDDILAWWRAAIRYWQELVNLPAYWERLRSRVKEIGDPQLPVEVVDALSRDWPSLLAAVHSALAFRAAEQSETRAAARHVALLGEIFPDARSTRRALERGAAPAVRRIDVRIAEMQRNLPPEPKPALEAARALIEHCAPDIHTLDTLCGRESEFFAEACTRMGDAALDALVSFQRATGDNASCLPLLVYLQTLPVLPEVARRLRDTFDVIFGNAVADDLRTKPDAGGTPEPMYARSYSVIVNRIVPAVYLLDIGEDARRACTHQLAELFKRVARDACAERDDIAFALHAYNAVLQLPSDQQGRTRWEKEREQFHQEFLRRKEKELRTTVGDHILEITHRVVRWDDQTFAPDEITALRHGLMTRGEGENRKEAHLIAWCAGPKEVVLDDQNAFADAETAAAHFSRIQDALYFFVVPRLVDRLVAAVRKGESVKVGEAALERNAIRLPSHSRLWKKESEVPYPKLSHRMEDGAWIVASAENARVQERYLTVDTWNAAIMGYVIDALAQSG